MPAESVPKRGVVHADRQGTQTGRAHAAPRWPAGGRLRRDKSKLLRSVARRRGTLLLPFCRQRLAAHAWMFMFSKCRKCRHIRMDAQQSIARWPCPWRLPTVVTVLLFFYMLVTVLLVTFCRLVHAKLLLPAWYRLIQPHGV
jgi:hypothetical protein